MIFVAGVLTCVENAHWGGVLVRGDTHLQSDCRQQQFTLSGFNDVTPIAKKELPVSNKIKLVYTFRST